MRFVIISINILLGMFAILLIVLGQLYDYRTDFLTDFRNDVIVSTLSLVTGTLLLITVAIGAWVSITKYKWAFIGYGAILVLVHLVQSVMGMFCFLETLKINDYVHGPLIDQFADYYIKNKTTTQVDEMQIRWKCCGMRNVTNWENVKQNFPESCCQKAVGTGECVAHRVARRDCKAGAFAMLKTPLSAVAIFAIMLAVLEFFLALWSFYMSSKM